MHWQQTRREFLSAATAGAAALYGLHAAASNDKPFRLRYVLASCMYGTTPVADILPEIKKTDSEAIDIWPRRHANQREQIEEMGHEKFRALLKEHGAQLGMFTRYDLGPYKLQDEMQVAREYGGRLLISGARNAEGKTLKDQVRAFVESMQAHAAAAEEHGVTIGIENHGNSLISTPDSIRYFAEFAKSKSLGIALAPYHLPQDEKLLAGLIEDLGPKLVHFYAWQHGMGCFEKLPKEQEMLQMPGRGDLDFTPLVAALKKIDYRGWTEVFMHPVPRGIPILETTAKVTGAINESREYLTECLKKVG